MNKIETQLLKQKLQYEKNHVQYLKLVIEESKLKNKIERDKFQKKFIANNKKAHNILNRIYNLKKELKKLK